MFRVVDFMEQIFLIVIDIHACDKNVSNCPAHCSIFSDWFRLPMSQAMHPTKVQFGFPLHRELSVTMTKAATSMLIPAICKRLNSSLNMRREIV